MIYEDPNIDLSLLASHFTTCGDYNVEVILDELRYWQKNSDFLVLISKNNGDIDGFLLAYPNRSCLWISQVWRRPGTSLRTSRKAIEMAKKWAREHGLKSLNGETDRKQMRAMERYGFIEESVNMKAKI